MTLLESGDCERVKEVQCRIHQAHETNEKERVVEVEALEEHFL